MRVNGATWKERENHVVDNICNPVGPLATGIYNRYRERFEPDSSLVGAGGDRIDLQPGHWPTHHLKAFVAAILRGRMQGHDIMSGPFFIGACKEAERECSLQRRIYCVPLIMPGPRPFFEVQLMTSPRECSPRGWCSTATCDGPIHRWSVISLTFYQPWISECPKCSIKLN